MLKHVHASEKRSCCPSRQKESGQFEQRGFARRAEDNELDAGSQARPHFDSNFASVPLFPPVQAKLSGGSAGDGQENEDAASSKGTGEKAPAAGQVQPEVDRQEPNRTGMPDRLKAGIEALSGFDMSDVRVHYNSPKPVRLNALAYTQGNQIHIGPGQVRHLAHEAWHVVQQKEERVKPTIRMRDVPVNEEGGLEREAEEMGVKAGCMFNISQPQHFWRISRKLNQFLVQRVTLIVANDDDYSAIGQSGVEDPDMFANYPAFDADFSQVVIPQSVGDQPHRPPHQCAEPDALAKLINKHHKRPPWLYHHQWFSQVRFDRAFNWNAEAELEPCPVCRQWVHEGAIKHWVRERWNGLFNPDRNVY